MALQSRINWFIRKVQNMVGIVCISRNSNFREQRGNNRNKKNVIDSKLLHPIANRMILYREDRVGHLVDMATLRS